MAMLIVLVIPAVVFIQNAISFSEPTIHVDDRQATYRISTDGQPLSGTSVGIAISMFGEPLPEATVRQDNLRNLSPDFYRIPVSWDEATGQPVASVPHGHTVPAMEMIQTIQSLGGEPLVIIGGRTTDLDIQPGDARNIARILGPHVRLWGLCNEPGNRPAYWTIEQTITFFNQVAKEIRSVDRDALVGGPWWAWYEPAALQKFAKEAKYDFLSYHRYAMGVTSLSTTNAMNSVETVAVEISELRSIMRSRHISGRAPFDVLIGETNWSWRYADDPRFVGPEIVAWSTAMAGETLLAGGGVVFYSDQNGPLGILTDGTEEGGTPRLAGTPNPIYHGMSVWTMDSAWPGLLKSGNIYAVDTGIDEIKAYAADNVNGDLNVIMVNTSDTLSFKVLSDASTTGAWQSDASQPFSTFTPQNDLNNLVLDPYEVIILTVKKET